MSRSGGGIHEHTGKGDGGDGIGNPSNTAGESWISLLNLEKVVGFASLTSSQTIYSGHATQINLDNVEEEDDSSVIEVDLQNKKIVIKKEGLYGIIGKVTFDGSPNWGSGDRVENRIKVGWKIKSVTRVAHPGNNQIHTPGYAMWLFREQSPDTDVTLECRHDVGSAETLHGSGMYNHLAVIKLG